MFRNITLMTLFDLNFMIRNRETMMWMFLMPIIFMFLIGSMTQQGSGSGGKLQIGIRSHDDGPLVGALIRHLETLDYDVVPVDDSTFALFRRQLTIPAGFSEKVIAGEKQTVSFMRRGDPSTSANLDQVRLNRALFRTLGDLVILAGQDSTISAAGFAQLAERPPAISVEIISGGKKKEIPSGFEQAVPGIMVMFILLVLLTTGGVLLVTEREEGLLRRLASAPVSRGEIVMSKLFARVALGFVQAVFAMLIGTVIFKVSWGGQLPGILVLLGFYGVCIAALSLLFGNLSRTRGQAVGFGVLAANLLGALGGCWWPIEVVPAFMQKIAWFLLTGWAMFGLHRLMAFGDPFSSVVPSLLLLGGSAVLFFYLAARTFRFQ